jgi:hypothetical protein
MTVSEYDDDVLRLDDSGTSNESVGRESWLAEQVRLLTLEDGVA